MVTDDPPEAGVSASAATGSTPYGSMLSSLRDTVKWMVAGSSAVAAVLVAGLQIHSFGETLNSSWLRGLASAFMALLALVLVISLLVSAVSVLAVPRLSVRDLSAREHKAGVVLSRIRLEPVEDELIQGLLERRTYLLGQHDSIGSFYRDHLAVLDLQGKLQAGDRANYKGREYRPDRVNDHRLAQALVRQKLQAAEFLEDAAQLLFAESKFRSLSRRLRYGGVFFALAVLTFAWLTVGQKPVSPQVSKPYAVRIYVKDLAGTGLSHNCPTELRGAAVGGTYEHPTVITEAASNCPSVIIRNGTGVIALPAG